MKAIPLLDSTNSLSNRKFYGILLLLHVIGFIIATQTGSIYLVDSIDYLSQAQNLVEHGSLYAAPWNGPYKPDYFTFRPPLYGLFIAGVKTLFPSDYAILFFQSIISLSTVWGVKKWLQQNVSQYSNSLLLLLLVFYPSQIIHCNFVMSDILFQSLLFWAFYFTHKIWHQPSVKYIFITAIFFVLAMLAKPVAYLMGMTVAIVFLIRFLVQAKTKLIIPFLIIPLTYHAYCSYNERITGHYHYSTVTPIFVLKYMGKYTNAQVYGENYADSVQDKIMEAANQMNLKERYHYMNQSGKQMILDHPKTFALFNIKGWIAFMVDPGRFEWVHFLNLSEGSFLGLYHVINTQGLIQGIITWAKNAPLALLSILLVCLIYNLLLTWWCIRFLFDPTYPLVLKIMLLFFVGYIVGATGVLGLSRYRVAVAPMLWIAGMCYLTKRTQHA